MITTVKPMSVEHARCLAMAYELHRLLGELNDRPENGEGSCVEDAWNRMDDVIGMLEPDEPDPDEKPTVRSLRLVEARKVRQ
jgi:hypothetical protein